MLNKTERLSRSQFETFFKKGKRFSGEHLQLIFTPHPTLHTAVVVGKKVHKRAVVRNKLRRRIYNQLRAKLHKKHTGIYIALVRPSFNSLSRKESIEHTKQLIEKILKQQS